MYTIDTYHLALAVEYFFRVYIASSEHEREGGRGGGVGGW